MQIESEWSKYEFIRENLFQAKPAQWADFNDCMLSRDFIDKLNSN